MQTLLDQLVHGLAGRISALETDVRAKRPDRITQPAMLYGFWSVVERTGGTYSTSGPPYTSWESQFSDRTASVRYEYEVATASGALVLQPEGARPVFAKLLFDVDVALDVKAYYVQSGAGNVQLVVNGVVQLLTASSDLTISLRKGRNCVVVMSDGSAKSVQLRARFFDGINSIWQPASVRGLYDQALQSVGGVSGTTPETLPDIGGGGHS